MGSVRLTILRLALAGIGLLPPGASALAQAGSHLALSVAAGPSPYDLSGTGTGFAAAMQLSWRPVSGLVIEPGLTYFTYESQFSERIHYLMNELSVQGELPLGQVRPFLGGGAGFARVVSDADENDIVATLHAVGGFRVDLSPTWGGRAEMRVRAVRPWTGNTVDFLFGFSRMLQ
ncbi:MAG: hypothetical protein H0T58_10435 [Gemmatimonadales bacterium]|nr:hypothetical protein [Gemmatimonadales bacterium]